MSHEGFRGGISQFNKVSRFLDAPNVLAGLDQKVIFAPSEDPEIDLDDDDDIIPFYNKNSLLKKVIDRYS